ncbi:MAG: Ig-like domain-containing protein, partial [Chordicoccus sp.]
WTNQDPKQNGGGRATAPDGKNGYYNGNGTAVLVTRKLPTGLAVTPKTSTIASNQTVQMTATATYSDATTEDISGTVTWTSSDPTVATVSSNGLVTAVKEGSVTITASVADSAVTASATVTVKNAAPTKITLTPSESSLLAGTTTTLTPSYEPSNVNESLIQLTWKSSDEKVATVDSDGVVTAVSDGTATITATYGSVSATATITVSKNSSRIYYYAALSKLDYTGSASGPNSIPAKGSDIIYAWVWNTTPSDGKQITLSKLGKVSGNDITYADGDIYYADDVVGSYTHIVFASGKELSATNLGFGYGQGTAQLTIPDASSVANPCFYAGSGDDSVYSSATGKRPGYWASLFTVFDPEKVSGSDTVYVATGTKPTTDSYKNADITYVSSTLYDYYSDYELNGKEVSTDTNSAAQVSQRNWVTFREFDQALSDYYTATGKTAWSGLTPIYTGHFQPDELKGTLFSSVASTLGLYGWSTNGSTAYNDFMATENSYMDINKATGQYAKASQGLVAPTLSNYQDGSLGTGVLLMDDGSTYLPHFNKQFLEGSNSKNAILGSVYEDVAFPFTQEKDPYYKDVSYYTFDSARESVYLRNDTSTGEKYLEDVGTDAKSKNVNSSSATSGVSTTYGYFPFNEDSTSGNAKTYDYGFGTKLEFQFTLNENGDVDSTYGTDGKAPTIFKFSGDDDVWVFIDGKLVLDLGGSHGQVEGAINFSSDLSGTAQYPSQVSGATVSATVPANSVWVSGTKATAGTATPYNLSSLNLQDGKKHTLTLYYMERGMWESNMMIQFNMSIEKTLTVKKNWKNYDGADLADSKKTTVYAAVKRSLPNGTSEFVNLTGSEATDGSQYLIPLTSSNQWTQTFSVDEYKNGAEKTDANKYTYYLYEVQVDSSGQPVISDGVPALYSDGQKMTLNGTTYQVSGTGAVTGTTSTITNTRQKGSGVTITKAWSGTSSDKMKPANIYVVLYETTAEGVTQKVTKNESGTAIGNANGVITLNSGNNWTASVEDLKASSSYTFKEVTDGTGTTEVTSGGTITLTGTNNNTYTYTVSGGAVTNGAATITNTFSAPKTQISITKSWADESGAAVSDDLPDAIYVKLKRTGTVGGTSVTQYRKSDGTFTDDESLAGAIELDKSASWTKTIQDLDVYADIVAQTVWTYSLCEESSESGTEAGNLIRANGIQYVVSYGTSFTAADKGGTLTVTNTKLPQISLTVQKKWENSDGNDIGSSMSQDVAVYLKRYTLDTDGTTEKNVGYYKVDDSGNVSFDAADTDDATQITLKAADSYTAAIADLDEYLASVTTADDGTQTLSKTPWHFELTGETSGDAKADTELLTGKLRITIDSTKYDVSYSGASGEDTSPTVTVTNKAVATYTLPGTGGRGRNMLLGILGGTAALAAVLYWNIRKTRRRRSKKIK